MNRCIARAVQVLCLYFLFTSATNALSETRYVVQNETIKDNKTGLTWHKKGFSTVALLDAMSPQGKRKEGVTINLNTGTIQDFLATLKVEGLTGWRLPSTDEIETLREFIDANSESGRLIFYITAADDKTKLGLYTGKAFKYIEYIFDEPKPDPYSSHQVILPVSNSISSTGRGTSILYKGKSICGGRQLEVSFIYDTSSSTVNDFKQVHSCVQEINDGRGTISEHVSSSLSVKDNRFSSSLVAEGLFSGGKASGRILGQMQNMKVQCSDGKLYSNCSDWVAEPQQ